MSTKFCGWVPTVTGNLSFSTIGNGRYPTKRFKLFREFDGAERFTVVAREKRTSDALFGRLGEFLNSRKGRLSRFVFLYFGTCTQKDHHQSIRGPIYILTLDSYSKIELELGKPKSEETLNGFATQFSHTINLLNSAADGILSRCGSELLRDGRHTVTFEAGTGQVELLASQAHFFMRDICHMHQHHEPTSDTIVDVYPLSKGPIYWKRETSYALFRWIIQRKRTRLPGALASAKGVLAYADAFKTLHIIGTREEKLLPAYMSEPLADSLDAALASHELAEVKNKEVTEKFFARFIPIVFGVLSIFALYISPSSDQVINWQTEMFSNLAQAIRDYPAATMVVLFIFPYTAMIWQRGKRRRWRREWARDFYRLAIAVPRWQLILSTFLLVAGLSIWIFGLAKDEIVPNRLHPSHQSK